MAVPNIFANVTTSIPLSQLDNNFATPITLGNASLYLGSTTTSVGNLTLTNVTISSGNITGTTITLANGSVTNAMLANSTATLGNTTITLGSTTSNVGNLTLTNATVNSLSAPLAESSGGTGTTTGYYGFKNRIINGAMVIDQRNAGASLNPADQAYSLDRWKCRRSQASKYTVQQNAGSVTPPPGFSNYLGVTSSSAYSVLTGDYFAIQQLIEGFNFADFAYGTANAATMTLSFWVRSSLTGTFGGALNNSAEVRAYGFTYTINAANTWEQKTITIAGDTSGTWVGATNGIGLYVNFNLGTGSTYGSATNGSWTNGNTQFTPSGTVSVVGTNGATFYITGVQLEKGSTATSFDYRPYGTELALCQRYCVRYGGTNVFEYMTPYGMTYVATSNYVTSILPVEMRSAPTISFSTIRWTWQGGSAAITGLTIENAATKVCGLVAATGGGETAYRPGVITANNSTSASLIFSAEL